MSFQEYWSSIYDLNEKLNSTMFEYWKQYSYFDTWQFWYIVFLLVAPLIILYFSVDRSRIFEILFYGFSVNLLWTYADTIVGSTSFFVHHYFLIPLLPSALSLNSAVLPVGYMLVYQYCTNHKKNYFLYIAVLSAIFAFGFATLEEYMGLVSFNKGMNQFYVFLVDIGIVSIAYWLTRFVLRLRTSDQD
ncbi:hypothetical protein SAMN05421676_105193 [Salinibacillus kushneri]|uniref:Uncharacterized protein n=1 Tax=Salinibacillus kushneri TaxID=237682 RepID=A0A1I0F5S5_9BACI|nr:hypothetical protein [Salinibacillus kushneri]SET52781.1 hypothetical protein SAMN05421676_105193 [Salinibacillus kushneri]